MLKRLKRELIQLRYPIDIYTPKTLNEPVKKLQVKSAWNGLELILEDIITRFSIPGDSCIEFGVEFGYSTVAFSNYFKKVSGIDTFEGDVHTSNKLEHYENTQLALNKYKNITLYKSDYRDWIQKDSNMYDFAHVDIVHNYAETFECGLWAANHSKCAVFHDTESFLEVRRAVIDIAKKTGKSLYNYPKCHGLGIIV